jgi:hypothetical protein
MDRSISDPRLRPSDRASLSVVQLTDQPVGRGHGGGSATRTELLHDEKRGHPASAQSPRYAELPCRVIEQAQVTLGHREAVEIAGRLNTVTVCTEGAVSAHGASVSRLYERHHRGFPNRKLHVILDNLNPHNLPALFCLFVCAGHPKVQCSGTVELRDEAKAGAGSVTLRERSPPAMGP